ncbi:MAG: NADPH:quinone oxidoreductase family protein [Ideonella sp.]|nr:NADPH:quinone oxidoreductase family protein [Ideonella sp.]MCC7456099.1 NADPH:quinone oxidoreductase family protein [Nitrospira sp.]
MQAWLCEQPIGIDALQWKELPTPAPGPKQVRVAIRAASLNFPDILIVQGKYQLRPEPPFVPGSEYAGVVDAVGTEVRGFTVGDKVFAVGGVGGFATHALVDAARVLPLPAGFTFEHGAAFALTYGTSYHALVDRAALRAGETVFVLGAAGGVGTAAIQIAKAVGARVIAGASSAAKCELCRSLGADATIEYSRERLRDALKQHTDGRGPDVVYDPVGGELAEPSFRSLAWRGRYLVIGFAQGTIPALPLNLPLLKGTSLVGVFWGEFVRREPQASAQQLQALAQWYAQGRIQPVIDRTLPMPQLREAFARMGSREVMGKIVLVNPG